MDSEGYRELPVADIVFSTTDDHGVITDANSIFGQLAQLQRAELLGSPHNIIRHPAMPGAVFKAMWETLQAGSPFVGYVRNRALDGKEYVAFATVTPLPGGGYLSVRTRPVVKELFSAAVGIYRTVRRAEDGYLESGMNQRYAAAASRKPVCSARPWPPHAASWANSMPGWTPRSSSRTSRPSCAA
ncbi:PAS domain-containing protein [Bowdeniella massiliensis]|uniref:PAS domain-containing protein n=1 Tax=Bowdeniella massiliensis TaxID=2932264 RepID=UPI0020281733